MKSIVITGTDVELNNALQKAIANFSGELEIAYASPFSDDLIENIGFSQPDYVIADFLNEEQVEVILKNVLKTTIVFISEDTNRTNAVISSFNKEGIFDFINLDKKQITPKDVLTQLLNYSSYMFEEVDDDTTENKDENLTNEENDNLKTPLEETSNDLVKEEEIVSNETNEEAVKPKEYNAYEPLEPQLQKSTNTTQEEGQGIDKLQNITQCQIITLYSKKGGTGNTTVAKEIGNIFANITLSKRISNKSSLDTCIVDFDFEQSNIRTVLGISNPNPNVYSLIDVILGKMEQGIPLSKIYFSEPEFKINHCIKLKNSPAYVLCLPQGDIPKRIVERMLAFGDEDLFAKIIKKIIQILKNCFNIVVIDTTSSYNDVNEIIFKNSNKIIYPMEPTLADLENLKVTLDETKENNYITTRLIPFVNKGFKSRFNESFLNIYEEIQRENTGLRDIVGTASYDIQVVNYNNNYGFYSLIPSQFKSVMVALCHSVLPIFKTKSFSDELDKLKKYRELEKKKQQKAEAKKNAVALNSTKKTDSPTNIAENTNEQNNNNSKLDNVETMKPEDAKTVKEYISSDLSGKDLTSFIEDLKMCSDITYTKKGFPKLTTQPKSLNKKVWKKYSKELYKKF